MKTYREMSSAEKNQIGSLKLVCHSECCQGRETWHDPQRLGVNGILYTCRCCGEERIA
jgi:hypothetical protein